MPTYYGVNQLLALLFSCLCGLAAVHAAGKPGKMPPAVGKPGPPALPNGVAPSGKDQHWYGIAQWTSLGDSYATGVGVGKSLAWNRCVHFSDAYPRLMNKDKRMPGEYDRMRYEPDMRRRLWDCSCSGATTQDILDHQFLDKPDSDAIYGSRSEFGEPMIATLTAGGDDLEFLWLVLYCVLQFFKDNPCAEQITRSRAILESDKFYNSLDYVVKNALIRGITAAGPGFKLFVTGYAQFFNEKTDQCDKVCFSYWDPQCKNSRKLDKGLRKQLNQLAKDLNQKIQDVVKNNKQWAVEYAGYDAEFAGHRFCEEGNTEPDDNNPNIWFFHLNTKGNGRTKAIDDKYAAMLDPKGNKDNFYADMKKRSATVWATGLKGRPDSAAYDLLFKVGDNKDVKIQNALSGYIRIFHPTRPGIDTITTKIFKQFPNWRKPDPVPPTAGGSSQPSGLPAPVCKPNVRSAKPFSEDDGKKAIKQICGNKAYWDKAFVAPVSVTTGKNNHGKGTALGASESIDIAGNNKLYVQVAFDETDCVGESAFVIGKTDDEKLKYCTDRFDKILKGCNKDKKGGSFKDVCMIYKMTAVAKDAPDPHKLAGTEPLGAFKCKDTDVSYIGGDSSPLKDTCTCWYEKLDKSTATFDKPSAPSKCADITKKPAATFEYKRPRRKRDEIDGGEGVPEREVEEGEWVEKRDLGILRRKRDDIVGGEGVPESEVEEEEVVEERDLGIPRRKRDHIDGGEGVPHREVEEEEMVEERDLGKLEELVRRHPARRYMGRGVLDSKMKLEFEQQREG